MKKKQQPINPLTVLSVDWDYFLPRETDTCDWGHSENGFYYYELAWPMRADNRFMTRDPAAKGKTAFDLIQIDPQRVETFWDKVLQAGSAVSVCLCDSHKDIVQFLDAVSFPKTPYHIVNFDAHHDNGYSPKPSRFLDCGNWAQHLRSNHRMVQYTLVYPEWRKRNPESSNKKHLEGIERVVYGEWADEPIDATFVFVCRSSCWMPSWCDEQWLQLRAGLLNRCDNAMEAPYVTKARPFQRIEWQKMELATA